MKKKIDRQFVLSLLLCLLPLVLGVIFYKDLPDQVAIHFDFNGEPNGFASKDFALFLLPVILIFIHLFVWFQLANDPKKKNYSSVMRGISHWLVPVLSVLVQTTIITFGLGITFPIFFFLSLAMGILFMVIGNYLPKCKQNYTMGIKLPWTLHDEDNWNRTHRLAGWTWMAGGILMILNAFLNWEWILWGSLALMVLIPFIYSYLLYRKKKANQLSE